MKEINENMKLLHYANMGITEVSIKEMLVAEDCALVIDMSDGVILFSTQRADELFGYIQGELQGMSFTDLIPVRYREKHKGHVEGFRKKSERRLMGQNTGKELFGLKKDGSEFEVEIELIPRVRYGVTLTFARVTPKRQNE